MTQDALLTAIEEDARELGRRIIAEAEEAAKELMKKAEEEAATAREARLAEVRAEVERSKAAALNRARTEARVEVLRAREEMVEKAIDAAIERLGAMNGPERARLVTALYRETRALWDGLKDAPAPTVYINPADTTEFKDGGAVVKADGSVGLGVVLISSDGRYRFENTLSSRRKMLSEALKTRVNAVLFG